MKKNWMRILALGLIAVMICLTLASCGNTTPDAEGDVGELKWRYISKDKELEITGEGAMPNFEKSSETPWDSIRASVEKITIENNVTSIGNYAFYGMNAVTEVELSSDVETIGDFAFAYSQKLAEIEIPSGVKTIGEGAFEGCGALDSIFLPNTVSSLGERAFAFCHSMTSVVIAGELEEIKAETFKNCVHLDNLVISDKITKVDENAFVDAAQTMEDAERTSNPNGESTLTLLLEIDDEVVDTIVYEKEYGEAYRHTVPAKEGYTADVEEVEGKANGADRTVTVKYTEDKETPVEEEEPEEEKNMTGIIIGIVIFVVVLAGIGVGAFFLLRSDKRKGKNGTTVRKNNAPKNGKKK